MKNEILCPECAKMFIPDLQELEKRLNPSLVRRNAELEAVMEWIAEHFKSGNGTPVERATIQAKDFLPRLESPAKALNELRAKVWEEAARTEYTVGLPPLDALPGVSKILIEAIVRTAADRFQKACQAKATALRESGKEKA